jgi:hypothetical protein
MRIAILLFSLCAGSAWPGSVAFGQSAPSESISPNPPGQSFWTQLGHEFDKLPPARAAKAPPWAATRPAPAPRLPLGNASIDPKMILHPTARDLGTQPPGTLVAQNLYPGLKFQPIDVQQCAPKGGPLSITWPKLRIEEIPIFWPDVQVQPVGGNLAKTIP